MKSNYGSILFSLADLLRGKVDAQEYQKYLISILAIRWHEIKSGEECPIDVTDAISSLANIIKSVESSETVIAGILKEMLVENSRVNSNKTKVILDILVELRKVPLKLEELILMVNHVIQSSEMTIDEFSTPLPIKKIISGMVTLTNDSKVADLFAGIGGIGLNLFQSNSKTKFYYYSEEINREVYLLSKLVFTLNGIEKVDITNKDAYALEAVKSNLFDYVVMDAPFSLNKELETNKVYRYGLPSKVAVDWANYQIGLHILNDNGKAIVTSTVGALYRSSDEEIRKGILEQDLVEAVILLPPSLYAATAIQTALIVFNKNKPIELNDKIVFVDASNEFTRENRKQNTIHDEAIHKILNVIKYYEDHEGFSTVTDVSVVRENSYSLNPSAYINANKIKMSLGKTILLKDVAEVLPGVQLARNDFETLKRNPTHYYLNIKNIQDDGIVYDEDDRIRDKKVNWYGKYDIRKGDLILTSKGTTSRVVVVPEDYQESFISNNLTIIRVNTKKYDPYVLKKYLTSEIGRMVLDNITTGTTIKVINASKLETIEIPDIEFDKMMNIGKAIKENEESYFKIIKEAKLNYELNNTELLKALEMF